MSASESARLTVIKSDGRREEFDREKLATGLSRALTRPAGRCGRRGESG